MEAVLHESDARRVLAALQHGLHEHPANALVLNLRIDRDRPHATDRVALVEEVRSDDTAVQLGDDAPDGRMRDPHAHQPGGGLDRREVAPEAVMVVDGAECVEDDLRAGVGVPGLDLPERHLPGVRGRGARFHASSFRS